MSGRMHNLAENKRIILAEVVRSLVDKALPQKKDYESNDLFTIGKDKFVMGHKNGSAAHDRYIYPNQKVNE